MADPKNVIVARNLTKSFRGKNILDHLSITWSPGAYCLYGKNGRGKSTLLKILAGAERDFSGSLEVLGKDAVRFPEETNFLRTFLPDHPSFYPKATTQDLLRFVVSIRGLKLESLLKTKTDRFGLKELLSKPLEQQSLGQRKRSFFGATLLEKVPLWILDEPTNGLDHDYQGIFFESVRSHIHGGGTVVIATHDPKVAAELKAKTLHLFPESPSLPVTDLR